MKYKKYNKSVTRMDVIWDVYDDNADNLKQQCIMIDEVKSNVQKLM